MLVMNGSQGRVLVAEWRGLTSDCWPSRCGQESRASSACPLRRRSAFESSADIVAALNLRAASYGGVLAVLIAAKWWEVELVNPD